MLVVVGVPLLVAVTILILFWLEMRAKTMLDAVSGTVAMRAGRANVTAPGGPCEVTARPGGRLLYRGANRAEAKRIHRENCGALLVGSELLMAERD